MEAPSPARLYATVAGALLVVLGILGFFYSASFGGEGSVEEALGVVQVNGWLNLLHVATGAIGLLLAGVASRPYALANGLLYTLLAILGWSLEPYLALGILGLAAAAGTKRPAGKPRRRERRRLEPRAKAVGKGA
jgi:hypothetical protein